MHFVKYRAQSNMDLVYNKLKKSAPMKLLTLPYIILPVLQQTTNGIRFFNIFLLSTSSRV